MTPLVLQRKLSQSVVITLRSAAALVVVVDTIIFVGPLFAHGASGHDTVPKIVENSSPTITIMTSPTPQIATATAGEIVLHLQQFHTLDGPNLHVFLSRVARPQSDTHVRNGFDIGPLLATDGDKDYAAPPNMDVSEIHSVVIYCLSFNAIFGYAR